MSAWIVSRAQIDALVLASVQFDVPFDPDSSAGRTPTPAGLAAAGAALWAENHRSVNHRYDESEPVPDYSPSLPEVVLDPVAVIKLIDCYAYQSCEHPGWTTSASADFCRRLREAALAGLALEPSRSGERAVPLGWDDRPWAFDDIMAIAQTDSSSPGRVGATGRP